MVMNRFFSDVERYKNQVFGARKEIRGCLGFMLLVHFLVFVTWCQYGGWGVGVDLHIFDIMGNPLYALVGLLFSTIKR